MRLATLGIAITLAAYSYSNAAEEHDYQLATASDLADLCVHTDVPAAIHMCHGYLIGVHHMHAALGDAIGQHIYCIPEDGTVTRNTAAASFVVWMSANPTMAATPAREALLEFARQNYPCN